LAPIVDVLHGARLSRSTVFICGAGPDAQEAIHLANALGIETCAPGMPRFRALGIGERTPGRVVERLRGLLRPFDVVVGIGYRAPGGVAEALRLAASMGATPLSVTNGMPSPLNTPAHVSLSIPHSQFAQREMQKAILEALCQRGQDLVPGLILAGGRGASPHSRAVGQCAPPRGAIFLDRDGVINTNRADYVKSWEELDLLPGAIEALRILACTPHPIVVVTNQSAVNRGLMSYEMAESINDRLMALVAARGGRIDAAAWCPHRPDEHCNCRKPQPGLFTYVADSLDLDLCRSYLVGDAADDLAAGMSVGCNAALVLTGRGSDQYAKAQARWGEQCHVYPDLLAASRWIADQKTAGGLASEVDPPPVLNTAPFDD
jgi:D-glycero-D-manno-heptose 1,7-bisphosphate phosphatase